MTAETITPNDDDITSCDNYGAVSSRPIPDDLLGRQLDHLDTLLHSLHTRLDGLMRDGDVARDLLRSDGKLLEQTAAAMANLSDAVASLLRQMNQQTELMAQLEPLVPLIPRALALLDPGRAMRRSMKRGKADV